MPSVRQDSHAHPARRGKPLSARGGLAGPWLRSGRAHRPPAAAGG